MAVSPDEILLMRLALSWRSSCYPIISGDKAMSGSAGYTSPNPVNPYNAASEKTAGARRSSPMRRKLVKHSTGTQAWASVDQTPIIGQWMSGAHDQSTKDRHPTGGAVRN